MKLAYRTFLTIAFVAVIFSCKNDPKNEKVEEPPKTVVKKEKKVLSQEEKDQVNSVMTKAMMTPELKRFSSAVVTANIVDSLSKNKGPYTVFAPSSEAFEALSVEDQKILTNPSNKERLVSLLQSHVVKGNFDSATLVQDIKRNGSKKMETLSGEQLTASMNGSNIVVKNASGEQATIGKSDILASNGVVHVVDNVLVKAPK